MALNWSCSAALGVAVLQMVRGCVGAPLLVILIGVEITFSRGIDELFGVDPHSQGEDGDFPLIGIRGSKLTVVLLHMLMFVFHGMYAILANTLINGMDQESYHKCKSWLWTMTCLSMLQSVLYTWLIFYGIFHVSFFIDPAINFISTWIVHRYMFLLLEKECRSLAKVNAPEAPPPSYEECTATNSPAPPVPLSSNHADEVV
jgi:hypothetical protein